MIEHVIRQAESTSDELARAEGRPIRRDEDPDLQLPFLLPEDGFSCDILRGVPNGFQEFLEPLIKVGKFVVLKLLSSFDLCLLLLLPLLLLLLLLLPLFDH